MRQFGDIIIDLLNNADDVQSYLASGIVPDDHRPRDLLPEIQAARQEKEEIKSMVQAQIDYESYLSKMPEGTGFLRFTKLPKDIVCEFVMKDLPFFLEHDTKFKKRGKTTYKFAVQDRGDFVYVQRLIKQNGWQKFGQFYSQD